MRIISKFRDFYDLALSQGADDRLVMVRHTEEYRLAKEKVSYGHSTAKPYEELSDGLKALITKVKSFGPELHRGAKYPATDKHGELRVTARHVLFVGKLYVVFTVDRKTLPWPGNDETFHCHDLHALNKLILAQKGKDLFEPRTERWSNAKSWPLRVWERTQAAPNLSGDATLAKTPVLLLQDSQHVILNPRLADYDFAKAIDPWQAFQELSMFMGNIASPDNCPVTISDKDRVQQRGFDLKYGFRTRPKT